MRQANGIQLATTGGHRDLICENETYSMTISTRAPHGKRTDNKGYTLYHQGPKEKTARRTERI